MLYSLIDNQSYCWKGDISIVPPETFLGRKLKQESNIPLSNANCVDYPIETIRAVNIYVTYGHLIMFEEVVEALEFLLAFARDYDDKPYYDIITRIEHDRMFRRMQTKISLDQPSISKDVIAINSTAMFVASKYYRKKSLQIQKLLCLQFEMECINISLMKMHHKYLQLRDTHSFSDKIFWCIMSRFSCTINKIIDWLKHIDINLSGEAIIVMDVSGLYVISSNFVIQILTIKSSSKTMLHRGKLLTSESHWEMPEVTINENEFIIDGKCIYYDVFLTANDNSIWNNVSFSFAHIRI
jgi:hypothetical protein